jgi:ABC-type glycerol-3-phosphate transport system substrate-binding protein
MKSLSGQSKITRRRILTGTAATAMVTATSRPRRAAAQSPVKLSIIGLDGHPSWLATKAMIEAYRDVAPNVSFELSQFDLPQIGDKVNLDFQAKKGQYDIVWMNSASTIGYWSEAGIVVPLDAMVSERYDLNDFLRLARGISTLRGKLYGIPIMIEGRMLVYRKDLLDAAGMKPPTTVDEMTRAAQAMNAPAKNQYGFSQRVRSGGSIAYDWVGWLYSFGGQIYDAKFNPQLASPEASAALEAFVKINQYSAPSSNRSYGEIVNELQSGIAAMANDVTIITPLLEDGSASRFAGKFGYAVAPAGPKGPRPETSSHLLAISTFSRQRDAAWRFLEWMTSKKNNQPWIFAGGAAFRESMYNDPAIVAKYPQYTLFKQILDLGNPDYVPRIKPSAEIMTRLGEQLSSALVGVKPVNEALAAADQQVASILKRNGYRT